jgi:Lrp/AsnC family transcriptional regulator for asnA, asnC and gidA
LIALLTTDGRMSNRALAAHVGLTEPTVAARLRSLSERHILAVTASLDWTAAGYGWDAWLQIGVEGRSVKEVSVELADVDGVHQVNVVFGPFDLIAHVLLATEAEAVEIISEKIGKIAGVHSVRPNVTLETVKFETKHARVPILPIPLRFPAPAIDLDQIDRGLIDLLVLDGRQSNREAARKLGVSEATVRLRLRRLEEARLLHINARSDPYLTGEVNAWAMVGVDVERGETRSVARALAGLAETGIVTLVAGSHDVLALLQVASRSRLVDLVLEEVRALPGVRSTSTWEIVSTRAFSYQWARLLQE